MKCEGEFVMDANVINELQNGLSAAYIDGAVAANLAYKPAFVSNNPEDGKKVISSVEDELLHCEEFQISVAFITMGGVTPLLQTLKELEKKGVKGQILTTNYLNFSEPKALEKLNGLKNLSYQETSIITRDELVEKLEKFVVPQSYYYLNDNMELTQYLESTIEVYGRMKENEFIENDLSNICRNYMEYI